jgi:hypothetical protein
MRFDRREFAKLAAGSMMASLSAPDSWSALALDAPSSPAPAQGDVPWYWRIKRIGQTNFNEHDPDHGDVEKWADYWASAKVQAVALSVSGPVAFYPTEVPYFHRSKFLKGRDLFGECVNAAKARSIRVYGRMSPDIQWVDPKLTEAHPLWLRHNEDGSFQYSAPDIAFTCQFSGQYDDQQPAIIRELNRRYDIDGIYMNGWPGNQVCYCDNCKKIGDPHSAKYHAALAERVQMLIDLYRKTVLEKSPHNFYSCNLGGGIQESFLDQWKLTRDANWYTADNQSRQAVVAPVWQDTQQVKFAKALMGDRPMAAVTASYSRAGNLMWRQVADTSVEPECRLAQTMAAGGIAWYHWLGLEEGFDEDRRWQKQGRDILSWQAGVEQHFHNVRSLAEVAIVASTRAATIYKAPTNEPKSDHVEGMYSALTDMRVPFDFVHEQDLTQERLAPYKLLVLPNMALISDEQVRQLEAYVQRGGSLLATFETGLYDENGNSRADFALGELFGVKKAGERRRYETKRSDVITSVYLQKIHQRNELTAGFEDTNWIAGPIWAIPVVANTEPVMTFINPYPVYPPEAVYPREEPTKNPSIVTREVGQSRLAYLPGDHDATFWRMDNIDLMHQIQNTVRWLLRGASSVQVQGDGLMEVIAWQTEVGYAVHMLNYNGPNAYRGRMRKLVSLGEQKVTLQLPTDHKIKRASLLRGASDLHFRQNGRTVECTVPSVKAYEVVAFEV